MLRLSNGFGPKGVARIFGDKCSAFDTTNALENTSTGADWANLRAGHARVWWPVPVGLHTIGHIPSILITPALPSTATYGTGSAGNGRSHHRLAASPDTVVHPAMRAHVIELRCSGTVRSGFFRIRARYRIMGCMLEFRRRRHGSGSVSYTHLTLPTNREV